MGRRTAIDWCDATWNPWIGCQKVSAGCKHCYAQREMLGYGKNFDVCTKTKAPTFYSPDKWKEPLIIFVCSWSDFFIARARALATVGRGKRDEATLDELRRVRDEGERMGLKTSLPALEEALARSEAATS